MPILGVGTDILFLPRIISLVGRRSTERLASRILSIREHQLWGSIPPSNQQQKLRFLAVRWCVKEAAYKASQPTLRLTWKQLSFLDDPESGSRKPVMKIDATDSQITSTWASVKFHASVSHDGDHIIAMVVAEHCTSNPL